MSEISRDIDNVVPTTSNVDVIELKQENVDGVIEQGDEQIDGEQEEIEEEEEQLDEEGEEEEEEEEESDSEASDEDDEDEEPPILRYSRLTQLPKTFFEKELISASLITEKFFVFGTSSGLLYITDLNYKSLGTFRIRKSPILSIGFDGVNHIIAGSIDGTVIIAPLDQLHSPASIIAYDLKTPIYSVVLNGVYRDTKSFIYGTKNGEVVMMSVNWIGSKIEKVLYKSDENHAIVKLEKIGNVLIIFNDLGILFMSLTNKLNELLLILDKPQRKNYPSELVWPKLNLQDKDRLIIGWVDQIWSIKFDGLYEQKEESSRYLSSAMSTFSRPTHNSNHIDNLNIVVEYEYQLKDSLIAGIGSFKDDLLIVLTISNLKFEQPPELRIINCYKDEEISTDEVILKNYKHLKINDLQLGQFHHLSNYKFFLICSYDCIIAEEYSLKDRFEFLIEKENYLQAWEISKTLISLKERCEIGIKQVEKYLNDNDNWTQSAIFLKQVLDITVDADDFNEENEDVEEFLTEKLNQWCWIFLKSRKYKELANILPINDTLKGSKEVYDEILEAFISEEDFENFAIFIKDWTIDNYHSNLIVIKLENYLEVKDNEDQTDILKKDKAPQVFRRCLAELYLLKNEPNSAIPHFIKLKDPIVLKLISKYHLINKNIEKLPEIAKLLVNDEDFTIDELENSFIQSDGSINQKKTVTESEEEKDKQASKSNESRLHELESNLIDLINLIITNQHEIPLPSIINVFKNSKLSIFNFLLLKNLSKSTSSQTITHPIETQTFFENELVQLYSIYSPNELLTFLKKNNNYSIEEALESTQSRKMHKELVYLLGKIGNVREAMNIIIDELNDAEYAIEFGIDYSRNNPEIWDILAQRGLHKSNFIKVIIEHVGEYFNVGVIQQIPKGVEIVDLKKSLVRIMKDNELSLVIQERILKILQDEGIVKSDELNELRTKGVVVNDIKRVLSLYEAGNEKLLVNKNGSLKALEI